MNCTLPPPERQPGTADFLDPGPAQDCPRSADAPPDPLPPDEDAYPYCGHLPTPHNVRHSALLDMALLLEAMVHDLKREIEEGVL